jgi:hypothetical protein
MDRDKVLENIVNISLMAGNLITKGYFSPDNSTELYEEIVRLAEDFEMNYSNDDLDFDYYEEIDVYAETKLLEFHGISHEEKAGA